MYPNVRKFKLTRELQQEQWEANVKYLDKKQTENSWLQQRNGVTAREPKSLNN